MLTVFGSAARDEPTARDLDVAVISEPGAPFDLVVVAAVPLALEQYGGFLRQVARFAADRAI